MADGQALTVESIWEQYGERIRRRARNRLGGDEARADAAASDALRRVADDLVHRGPVCAGELAWFWIARIIDDVCGDAGTGSAPAALARSRPGPESVASSLRLQATLVALRHAEQTALLAQMPGAESADPLERSRLALRAAIALARGFAVVAAVGHLGRAVWGRMCRARRGALRRIDASLVSWASDGAPTLTNLLTAASTASQAAAALTALVVIGVGGGATSQSDAEVRAAASLIAAGAPMTIEAAPATPSEFALVGRADTAERIPASPASEPVPASPEHPTGGVASVPSPSPPVAASLETDATDAPSKPIETGSRGDWRTTDVVAPAADVSIDGDPDGDGDDDRDVSTGAPQVFWDCAPPPERGAASAVVCPVLVGE